MSSKRPLIEDNCSSSSSLKRSKTEPSTPPKDLSGIFSHVVPISVVSTPSKSLTRRMLAKSKTESMVMASPSKKTPNIGRQLSLPAISPLPGLSGSAPPPPLSPTPSSSRAKANVRTYSQVRSFLIPLSLKNDTASDKEVENQFDESKESYSTLRSRLGVDHSEDNPFHVSGLNNDLSTITELRSKGEARRFLDEVGYLFEGLESGSGVAPSVRRSSAFEIISNMCDPDFMRKAKATDFTNLVWNAMVSGQPDKAFDFYIASFMALVAREKRDIGNLSQKSGFFEVIRKLTRYPKEKDAIYFTDIRKLKSTFSKSEIMALTNLRQTIIMKSGIFQPHSSLSLRTLVSYVLKQLPILAIPEDLLSHTHQQLLVELSCLQTDIEAYVAKKELVTFTAELHHIQQCLSLLDSTLMTRRTEDPLQKSLNSIRESLIPRLAVLYGAIQCSDERFSILHACAEDLLRIFINLSNMGSSWAARISEEPAFIRRIVCEITTVTKHDGSLDGSRPPDDNFVNRQCLSLALLSSLVLTTDKIKHLLRENQMSQDCSRNVACILECECEPRISALQVLITLFIGLCIKSEAHSLLFFRAHVAALLCLLTVDHPTNRIFIATGLKKKDALLGGYGLKESIQSFQKFYTDTDIHSSDSAGPIDIQMQEQIKEACHSLCSL